MKNDLEKIISQYKYCFKCRGNLEVKGENWLQCKSCGYRNYVNPAPTSGAVLTNDKGEILLVKRSIEPSLGMWDSPGGFIDIGENAEDGMARELKEELGIDLTDFKYIGSYVDTYVYDGIKIVTLGFMYSGKLTDQEIILKEDESSEYRFFKPDEIPFGNIAFKGVEDGIRDYLKNV